MATKWATREVSGWGRFPVVSTKCARPERRSEALAALADRCGESVLAHGLGRSYGDAALTSKGRVIMTERMDRMLAFDPETGWLRCEAGVTLADIVRVFLPRGFFPPVVPGTQFVTVAGALGCNIHGKNHHVDGCWGDHVRRVELLTGTGEVVFCDAENQPELFWATVGGMGLTGLILSLEVRLMPVASPYIEMESIRVESLDEFFAVSAESGAFTHTVSWIDCIQQGQAMGRGIFMRGRHAPAGVEAPRNPLQGLMESAGRLVDGRLFHTNHLLNPLFMRAFNETYFRKHPRGAKQVITEPGPFFFPLDAVQNWNYAYGPRGFLQYQMVLPPDPTHAALREILSDISRSGMASFLAVIKEFGARDHGGLSFPRSGVTLAMDFPNHGAPLYDLLNRLDEVVLAAGGRIYLGKDARLGKEKMRQMYPEWEKWKAVRDQWDPQGVFHSDLGKRFGLTGA